MKGFRSLLLVPFLLFAILTLAQTYQAPPHFNHVVIVVQENRTPDNIYGSASSSLNCGGQDDFETGVDIQNGGYNDAAKTNLCLTPKDLPTGGGDHSHTGWVSDYGKNDNGGFPQAQYTYVPKSQVQPYFDIATNYGFANYMFHTQEGPSFLAHQFLFGGTSAPGWPVNNQYHFVAENPHFTDSGCPVSPFNLGIVDPNGNETYPSLPECYDRNTLVTYQDANGVHDWSDGYPAFTWKYYTPTRGIIWDAPEADPQTCYTQTSAPQGATACTGKEWNHVSLESVADAAPFLNDVLHCQLPSVSWVIPDERWSDHPSVSGQPPDLGYGPDYVAAIVNSIGQSTCNDNGQSYWQDTAILITWDDWGGFYDHVPPPAVYKGDPTTDKCLSTNAPNGWGCGYVYGFRVPLLVVSAWTPPHTISGQIPTPGATNFQHDFGSILKFVEHNFTTPNGPFPTTYKIAPGNDNTYTYADSNSLDTGPQKNWVPLWDFFLSPSQVGFAPINPINSAHNASFFINYFPTNEPTGTPTGPESGDPED